MWYDDSDFIRNLNEDDDDKVDLDKFFNPYSKPYYNIKPNTDIESIEDLKWLFRTMSQLFYTGELPNSIFDYAIENTIYKEEYEDFIEEVKESVEIFEILRLLSEGEDFIILEKYDNFEVFRYILDKKLIELNFCDLAKNYKCLKYAMDKGYVPTQNTIENSTYRDDLDSFILAYNYLKEIGYFSLETIVRLKKDKIFKWIVKNHPEIYIMDITVSEDNIEYFKYLLDRGFDFKEEDKNEIVINAVKSKSINSFKLLLELGYLFNKNNVVKFSIENNQIEFLKHLKKLGYNFEKDDIDLAAEYDHVEILKFLHESGCSFAIRTLILSIMTRVLPWYIEDIKKNECFLYLINNGCPFDISCINACVKHNNFDAMIELRKRGCLWDESTCREALISYKPDFLRFLHENNCPWNSTILMDGILAHSNNSSEYAILNGCPFNLNCMNSAAQTGNYLIMRLLHENGCPWDQRTTSILINNIQQRPYMKRDYYQCLQYAIENSCPYDKELIDMLYHKD